MSNDGSATPRPTLSTRRRDDDAPAAPSAATPAAPADDAAALARAVEALLLLAVTLPAYAVLRRLARAPADWHLVSDAAEVCGTWLGVGIPHATVWAPVDASRLPSLGMVAINAPEALAELAHDRPWEAHAVTLRALAAAARAASEARRGEVRVTLGGPDGARAITLSTALLCHVVEALEALGEPRRPVWAYLLDDDGDDGGGRRRLVLDGAGWLALLDDGHTRPLLTGRAAVPWHLELREVVSTIDPAHVGGRRVPLLSLEAH